MSRYRRVRIEGGWFFFTLTLADRSTDLLVRHIERLRAAYAGALRRDPFETIAICVLPDHLHAIWALPPDDADFSRRWSLIKHDFSCGLPGNPNRSPSKHAKREKGIWQRRYWEHAIRDDTDLARHVDYIHYNPVKHLVSRTCDWPYSSFHRYVARDLLPADWGGDARHPTGGSFGE
ncbi:MAG: transposase [Bradyrhizobiaceae bacterium]|nr:transposase [Bradyrhizobiaceae bacterium]